MIDQMRCAAQRHSVVDAGNPKIEKNDRTMSKKNNWTCSACGMSSGRRYSLQRHINNKNIHAGKGTIIPTPEYLAGVNLGLYNPSFDSLVNTQSRIMSEHQAPVQKKDRQKFDGAAINMNDSQAGEGTKIYFRKRIERIAEHDADEMIKSWKGKPADYILADTALDLRGYEMALDGKLDLAAEIEKLFEASMRIKVQELRKKFLGLIQSATKNNEEMREPARYEGGNQAADCFGAEANGRPNRDRGRPTAEQQGYGAEAKKREEEDLNAILAKAKGFVGKKPDDGTTWIDLLRYLKARNRGEVPGNPLRLTIGRP